MYDGSWASRDQRQREACRQNSVVKRYKKSKVKNQNEAPVKEETLGEQKSEGSLIYRGYTSGSQASRPLNTIPSETLFATVSDFHQPDRVEWQPTAPRDEVLVETNQVQTYYKERSEPLSETDQGYIWKTLMMKGLDSSGFSMTDIDMVRHLPTQFLLAKQFGFLIVNFDDQLKLAGKAKISESKWLEIEGLGVYPSFSELIDVVSSGSVDVLFVMLIVEMV